MTVKVNLAGITELDFPSGVSSASTSDAVTTVNLTGGSGITTIVAGTGLTGGGSGSSVTVALDTPVAVANGGTGTNSPSLVAGTNVTITGSWPNQTVNSSGGGGGSANHFTATGSTPAVSPGSSAGTGATVTINGRDAAGQISLNTGTGASAGDIVDLTFAVPYASTPVVLILTPANISAASTVIQFYVSSNTTGLTIFAVGTPPSLTNFIWNYWVIELG